MNLAKYIFVRMVGLVILVFLANELYKLTFYSQDISKHADVLENYWSVPSNCEALYFGESSNFYRTDTSAAEPKISQLIDGLLPDLNMGTVDNSGLHSGTFLAVIKNIPTSSSVKIFVITLNMRSFGPTWRYALGENYLAKTEEMLEDRPAIINKFMVSLKEYDYLPDSLRNKQMLKAFKDEKFSIPNFKYDNMHQWDSAMAWGEWSKVNPHLTRALKPLAASYIKNYAFIIDTLTNERIHDFDEIMELATSRNINVVLNLLDYNHEEAFRLVGPELKYLTDQNRTFLKDRYSQKGALVVDNMYTISDSCFTDREWPTEHYCLAGKKIIAHNVAKEMKDRGWNQ